MALVPARDHLGEFLLLLDSTNGRDKLCRFIQYSSKALKWRAEVEKQPEDTIKVGNEINNGRALTLSASVGTGGSLHARQLIVAPHTAHALLCLLVPVCVDVERADGVDVTGAQGSSLLQDAGRASSAARRHPV